MNSLRHLNLGLSLLELMTALAVAGILMVVGVPSFRYVTNANRIAGEINGLLGDLQLTRAEAIKQGRPVTICRSVTGAACAVANTWQSGWIVFLDANGNQVVNAGEAVLRVQRPFAGTDSLVASNNVAAVTFNREGFAFGLPGTVTMTLHDQTGNAAWTRCLAVSIVGQLQTQSVGTGACL
ncbi:MAG: GspH/FimT family pseudopilin [Steroidobacterales bacterium]